MKAQQLDIDKCFEDAKPGRKQEHTHPAPESTTSRIETARCKFQGGRILLSRTNEKVREGEGKDEQRTFIIEKSPPVNMPPAFMSAGQTEVHQTVAWFQTSSRGRDVVRQSCFRGCVGCNKRLTRRCRESREVQLGHVQSPMPIVKMLPSPVGREEPTESWADASEAADTDRPLRS